MSRLPLRDPEELPQHYPAEDGLPEVYEESRHKQEGRLQNSQTLRALANNPTLNELHTNTFLRLWQEEYTGLQPRENELIIMTMGREFDSKNEWNSHLLNALLVGVTEEEVLALAEGDYDRFDERESTLLRYVTAFANMEVADDLHEELAQYYDDGQIVGIMVLAGYYSLCALVIEALGIEPADPGAEDVEHLGYDALLA